WAASSTRSLCRPARENAEPRSVGRRSILPAANGTPFSPRGASQPITSFGHVLRKLWDEINALGFAPALRYIYSGSKRVRVAAWDCPRRKKEYRDVDRAIH